LSIASEAGEQVGRDDAAVDRLHGDLLGLVPP
jgi:hypothetical protein